MPREKKIITIHQPDFMPWLGFFDRWKNSHLFIILDDVRFLRRGWHHRDKIKTQNSVVWLTVPVLKKGRYLQSIKEVEIDNSRNWKQKHLSTIEQAYGKAKNFNTCFKKVKDIYYNTYKFLMGLNMDLLRMMAGELGIDVPIVFAYSLNVKTTENQRLIDLVKQVGGTHYLTGTGSKSYLKDELFEQDAISTIWQDFQHPVYKQLHGPFVPGLSTLDYLMNHERG